MQFGAMTWNLFHGRDWPPETELQVGAKKWNWRRGPRLGVEYEQVNRDLFAEFASKIEEVDWDIALFQEFPPRWRGRLAEFCRADAHRALSARNWLQPLTSLIGRWRPDLIGSWEGGSNTTLVRRRAAPISERRRVVLTRRPELRVMALTRLESSLCVANLHASTRPASAEAELISAAERAIDFAQTRPLVFGGDFNVRPRESEVFERLRRRFGLAPQTAPDRLSHLLVRGLEVAEPPAALPPEARDVVDPETGLKIRLSDHHPVIARFAGMG
ncbi:MAG TPA: endonuclease/exonuclease/phosphatase family protein [Solirubrobacterales bacterium]|nr:endonuclease/exonuclease/phosphatase family protein [Solirubrobacterales bacterium]